MRLKVVLLLLVLAAPALASDGDVDRWRSQGRGHYLAGRFDEALESTRKALAAQEARKPSEPLLVASILYDLGSVHSKLNQFAEAQRVFERCLAIRESLLGGEHADIASTLYELGFVLNGQGRYADAERTYLRALAMREGLFGATSLEASRVVQNLGSHYSDQGLFEKAQSFYERALAQKRAHPKTPRSELALSLNDIGLNLSELGRYPEAIASLEEALGIWEGLYGPEHKDVATALHNIAGIHTDQGDYEKAEALLLRALRIDEKLWGKDHPKLAYVLNSLGLMYWNSGRLDAAEVAHRRALAIREQAHGPRHADVARSLNNLAVVLDDLGRRDEAMAIYLRVLEIEEAVFGKDSPTIAGTLNNLAIGYLMQGKPDLAEPHALRSLALHEREYGPGHPSTLNSRNTVAGMYADQGKHALAEPMFKQNIAGLEAVFGPDHPNLAQELSNLAMNFTEQGRPDDALVPARRATAMLRKRFTEVPAGIAVDRVPEQRASRPTFIAHLYALDAMATVRGPSADIAAEGLEVSQLAQASSVGGTVAQMAARFAGRGDELARVIRAQQDIQASIAAAVSEQVALIGQPAESRNAEAEAAISARLAKLRRQLSASRRQVATRFPEYLALVSQAPVSAASVQELLREGEALLVYTVVRRKTFAWVVRADRMEFFALPLGSEQLTKQVQLLRAKLAPDGRGRLPEFTPATSRRLYESIFAPLETGLSGASRVFLVADGPLQGLPFGLLGAGSDDEPEWLARRHAFAVLPTVGALQALRKFNRGPSARDPFAGFGDPVLEGRAGEARALSDADVFTTRSAGKGIADVESLRQAPPLPETGDELRSLARALGGGPEALFLRERATETRVKSADLSRFRMLAFATHGIMAGELAGASEPGLVLTPPTEGTAVDDGYLSASEVAQLRLNAEWVLLSACNTAAPDGRGAAEGLSGLARAFFFAGSRALLVSNWPVSSKATKRLVTDTVSRYAATGSGKPEALQAAMLAMMDDPDYAHPFYWAPFSVVGD